MHLVCLFSVKKQDLTIMYKTYNEIQLDSMLYLQGKSAQYPGYNVCKYKKYRHLR